MKRIQGATAVQAPPAEAGEAEASGLAEDLQRLRDLLDEGHIEAARRLVKELEPRWPDSERVRHYARVLAPPVARRKPGSKPRLFDREWGWLEAHVHEYPGCWMAIYEDRLVAADPDRRVVVAKARSELGQKGALLYYQPPSKVLA